MNDNQQPKLLTIQIRAIVTGDGVKMNKCTPNKCTELWNIKVNDNFTSMYDPGKYDSADFNNDTQIILSGQLSVLFPNFLCCLGYLQHDKYINLSIKAKPPSPHDPFEFGDPLLVKMDEATQVLKDVQLMLAVWHLNPKTFLIISKYINCSNYINNRQVMI